MTFQETVRGWLEEKEPGLKAGSLLTYRHTLESTILLAQLGEGSLSRLVGHKFALQLHESATQMSLFEDPALEYYRQWDRQYDERDHSPAKK